MQENRESNRIRKIIQYGEIRNSIMNPSNHRSILCQGGFPMSNRHPWQYNEMIQAGADHADLERVTTYDEYMQKLQPIII